MALRISILASMLAVVASIAASSASAQATSYSGRARPLSVSAVGVGVAIGDTGPLPSTGGSKSASLTSLNVLGLVQVGLLEGTTSGSGDEATSSASLVHVAIPIAGIQADLVKSQTTASCNGATPSVSGSSDLVNVTVLGFPVAAPMPSVAITVPGGISVILNEQKSDVSGNHGSMTVNAIHVIGPGVDIVLSSAESDITCA